MPDSRTRKRQILEKRLEKRLKDYEDTINQQDMVLDKAQQNQLERKAKAISEEIDKLESEINSLELTASKDNVPVSKPDAARIQRELEAKLCEIDFKMLEEIVRKILRAYAKKECAVLLLFEQSLSMGGRWCAKRIRELFRRGTSEGQLREIPVTFTGRERADRRALLTRIGHDLGVKPVQDLQRFSQLVVEKLCGSLQNGSVVIIKCEGCDYLQSYEPEIFHWVIKDFWRLMIRELSAVAKQYYGVKILLLLFVDGSLREQCLPAGHCSTLGRFGHHEFEKEKNFRKLLRISLMPWTKDDIEEWIVNYSGHQELSCREVDVIANKIYESTQSGLPLLVGAALLKEFCPEADK